jgi:hypothetical protein
MVGIDTVQTDLSNLVIVILFPVPIPEIQVVASRFMELLPPAEYSILYFKLPDQQHIPFLVPR